MRWLALALGLLAACVLVACASEPAMPVAAAPTAIDAPSQDLPPAAPATDTATPRPSPTPQATRTPTASPSEPALPTRTATPKPTATPSPTPIPTLPPLLPPADGQPLAFSLGWQFNANGHLTAGAPVTMGGQRLYLLSSLGRALYALGENGSAAWSVRAAGPIYALAALDGDRVATGDDAGTVTLFGGRGQRLWQRALDGRVTGLQGWLDGVLAGDWAGNLVLLNVGVEDERVRWQLDLGGPISAVTVLPDLALAATLEGMIVAVDRTGETAWRLDAGALVVHLEVVAISPAPVVLAGLQDGRIVALDAAGTIRWQRSLGPGTGGSPVWHAGDLNRDGSPEVAAGTGGDGPVLALLDLDGQVLWRTLVPSPVQAMTIVDLDGDGASEILAGLASGEIFVYDGQGRRRGSVHAGLPVWGLEAAEEQPAGPSPVLVWADVVAWQLRTGSGNAGGPWLPPPAMVPLDQDALPAEAARKEGEAILVFVGDVAPGRSMEAQLARYGPAYPWRGLELLLQDADLAVANLESVLSTHGEPLQKPYVIRAHPSWAQSLVEGGFDLVTVANNHALDYGQVGLDQTLDTLAALDVASVGAGRTAEEARRSALFTVAGVRVAVLGYAAPRWNGSEDVPTTDRLAWAVPGQIAKDVRAVRGSADLVVVLLHAGTEYAAEPSADQVAAARAAIDAGADLVVGHHPHVTQTVERYKQGLVVYSLGDTVFDIPRVAAMRGDLLRIHATQAGLVRAELWPFWIEDEIRPRLLDDGKGVPQVKVIFP
jgi:poly-gamma-glutamate capsule biosynthesis protein CapA/YwtB (metallophosphatase superfamily)